MCSYFPCVISNVHGFSLSAILTVRLGSMLMYTPMDDDCQSLIKTHIQRFVKYAVELLFYLV